MAFRSTAMAGALVLVISACAPLLARTADRGSTQGGVQAAPCTAAVVRACALPYPSDEFTVADAGTATGLRVEMPDGLIPAKVLDRLGPGASMADAFRGADGFSALSPIVFEVDVASRPESLPADGGDVVEVFDASTGERQPIRADLLPDAAWHGAPGTVVMAWPNIRWDYGHTYIARLAGLRGAGQQPSPPPGVARAAGALAGIRESLAQWDGTPWSRVLSATRFTVGSRASVTGELDSMAEAARAQDHPVRKLKSRPPLMFANGAATIVGEVQISDFRDENGVVHPDVAPHPEWIPFLLTVPKKPASERGAPVAVYGHGLLINKESMIVVASANAAHGVATIGIDMPNHGARMAGQGGYILDLANPHKLGRLVNLPAQGIIDHVSLVRAIVDHLTTLDLSPWRMDGPPGDGIADLDTSRILYEGTSMGGVLGAGEVALIPEFDAAYLQVAGAGITDILTHSVLWPLFAGSVPSNAEAGDAGALIGAATMLLDRSDPTHLLERIRDSNTPVFVQIGVGDKVVPVISSNRLVQLLDLPRVGEKRAAIEAPSAGARIPADGRGFAEVWPLNSSPVTQGLMAHLSMTEPAAGRLLNEWLDQRLTATGVGSTRVASG